MQSVRYEKLLAIGEDIEKLWNFQAGQREDLSAALEVRKPNTFETTLEQRKDKIKKICPECMDVLDSLMNITANLILKTPKEYIFHDFEHTFVYVLRQTEELLTNTNLSPEEKRVVYIAAIMHDIGHLVTRKGHERYGQLISQKLLEIHNISQHEREAIELLIESTSFPHDPDLSIDETIKKEYPNIDTMINMIRDADLGHLSTSNFEGYTQQYIKYLCETIALKPRIPDKEIELRGQQYFHQTMHHYKTPHASRVRKDQKQKNLEQLESIRDDLRTQLEKYDFNYSSIQANRDQIRSEISP